MEDIVYKMLKPGKTGTATNMRIEDITDNITTKVYCPKQWTNTYKKGSANQNRTYAEEMPATRQSSGINCKCWQYNTIVNRSNRQSMDMAD